MQPVTLYFWRVKDTRGKWVTTQHRLSEETARDRHPEAECIYAESLTIPMPESPEETAQRLHLEHLLYPASQAVLRQTSH